MPKFTPYNSFTRIHKLAKLTRGSRLPIQVVNANMASKTSATLITTTIQNMIEGFLYDKYIKNIQNLHTLKLLT